MAEWNLNEVIWSLDEVVWSLDEVCMWVVVEIALLKQIALTDHLSIQYRLQLDLCGAQAPGS